MRDAGTHYREMKMQQTKSYWRLVAVAGVVSAFIASACVVTTGSDGGSAGTDAGGSGAAGAGTAGASAGKSGAGTAGSAAGTAGSATGGAGGEGPVPFQCDMGDGGAVGMPNTCAPNDPADVCQKCTQAKCCTQYAECYATEPGNQCGWGGPAKVNGDPNPGGEAYCLIACIQKGVADSGTAPDAELIGTCGNNCATTKSNGATQECGSVLGAQTSDLIGCLKDNCSTQCFGG